MLRGVAVAVGGGVVGAAVVGAGVSEGGAVVGAGVRGATVNEIEGDALADEDGDGDGELFGAATCCDAMIAPPSRRRQTRASAAKTVKTVDHLSAGRRPPGGGGGAFAAMSGGRSSCSVASVASGFRSIAVVDRTLRAERTPARPAARYTNRSARHSMPSSEGGPM